ncbi:MAG: substrate-binding domain-containing protein, partial [Planctomycetota bacterium]
MKINIRPFRLLLAFLLTSSLALTGCDKGDAGSGSSTGAATPAGAEGRPTVAFVTNGIATFWDIAKAGALAAGKEFNVNVDVRMPAQGIVDQNRIIEDLVTRGVDGIAISPIDPNNQAQLLNGAATKTFLITHDSDAPNIDRLC